MMQARRDGFTLVELVLVMVIAGAMLAIAIPYIDFETMQVRSTERSVSLAVTSAQSRAIMRQHDVRLVFDTVSAPHRLIVHDDRDNDGNREAGEWERTVELAEGVKFTRLSTPGTGPSVSFDAGPDGLPALTFHRSGTASETGSFFLGTPRTEAGLTPERARRLTVQRSTGRVTRYRLDGGAWTPINR